MWDWLRQLRFARFRTLVVSIVAVLGASIWCGIFASLFWDMRRFPTLEEIALISYVLASFIVACWVLRQNRLLVQTKGDYQLFINALKEPSMIHADGKVLDANDDAVEFFGATSKEDLIGSSIVEFAHPDFRALATARVNALQRGESTERVEQKWLKLSGEVRDVDVVGVPVHFQGKTATQVLFRDITERKQTEFSLREAIDLMHIIEDNIEDFICVLEPDGTIQYASPNIHRLLGRGPEIQDRKFSPENLEPHDAEAIAEAFRTGDRFRRECSITHGGGTSMKAELDGKPILNESGTIDGYIVVVRDITERKRTEELLRRSDKLSAVGELAAGVAHEIRNPLTAVQGFVQILKSKADEDNVKYFDIMLGEIQRIQLTLGELLLLARPQEPQFKRNQVGLIMQEVLSFMNSQAHLHNVHFQFDMPQFAPEIYCDENQLKQVFINIVKNAIEAMPSGGHLLIQAKPEGGSVVLQFTDTGVGISKEHLERLGQPFYTTKAEGTGLGMMVTQRIVQGHGGTLAVESTEGVGTTIEVRLPMQT